MQIWEITRSEIGIGTPPVVPDPPRPLKKVYGPNWEARPDAAELKKEFTRRTSARSKALKEYKEYVARSNRHFTAVKDAIARGENVPQAVLRDYGWLKENPQSNHAGWLKSRVNVARKNTGAKTKLDLLLDKVTPRHEVTFDVRDYTEEQKQRIITAAKGRGLDVGSDGKHILVRKIVMDNPYRKPKVYQFEIGDKVKYKSEFLRNIGAFTGNMGPARGTITALQYFDGTWDGWKKAVEQGDSVLATIHWGKDHGDLPEKVNTGNLIKASTPNPKNPGERIYGVGDSQGPSTPDGGQQGLTQAEAVAIQKNKPWLYIFKKTSSGNWSFVTVKRKNPESAAAGMYESFHGRPSEEVVEVQEKEHYHGHLSALGDLVSIKVRTVSGYDVELGFESGGGKEAGNPQKWILPFRKNKKNYEDVGYLPFALEHDTGFSGKKMYRPVKVGDNNQITVGSTELHSVEFDRYSRKSAVDAIKKLAGGKQNPKSKSPVKGWIDRRIKATGDIGNSFMKTWINPQHGSSTLTPKQYEEAVDRFAAQIPQAGRGFGTTIQSMRARIKKWRADGTHAVDVQFYEDTIKRYGQKYKGKKSNPPYGYQYAAQVSSYHHRDLPLSWHTVAYFKTVAAAKKRVKEELTHPDKLYDRGRVTHYATGKIQGEVLKSKHENPRRRNPSAALLCSNEDGDSLYLEGGDQSLDLKAIHMDGDWKRDSMVIGDIHEITYRTEKDFDKFETIDYYHALGEETGDLPTLRYDTMNKKLHIDGGRYFIDKPLLGTSPGIEN